MAKRLIVTGIIALVLLGALAAWQFVLLPGIIKNAISSMRPPPVTVTAETAKKERWIERLNAIGTLIASQGVDVASQVAGVVTEVLIESGSDVQQGAKLVQLDIAVELADLASANATLQEAEVAFSRQNDLIQKRVTSEANLDTARAKRDTAAAAVKRIEAVIAQKSILAPFTGRVGIRKVEKGQYITAGQALVSLQALDPIRVDFPMPEQSISKLQLNQTVELTVDSLPGQVFKGEIQSLDARVSQDTRTLLVRGIIPNKERKLLPGMFANVTVLAGQPTDVVTVPRTAVTFSLYGDSVYVVKPAPPPTGGGQPAASGGAAGDAKPQLVVERRFVKTAEMRDARVAIATGLAEGEQVVTAGQLKLNPGAHVVIDDSQALAPPAKMPKQ